MSLERYISYWVVKTWHIKPLLILYNALYKFTVYSGMRAAKRRFLLKMMPTGGVCVEIGVWKGEFSREIYRITRPKALYLVDAWIFLPGPGQANRHYGTLEADGQAYMDALREGVKRDFFSMPEVQIIAADSHIAAHQFPDKFFDWIYLDANHCYDYIKKDLELWWPKIKTGGYLTGDDYYWHDDEGVATVEMAVQEFIATHPHTFFMIKNNQYIIRLD